jgi:hypothetical protein
VAGLTTEPTPAAPAATLPADASGRVWYGGTLEPVTIVATTAAPECET